MYTVLGAPLLGFDLARRPGGAEDAGLVRDALATDGERLTLLGAALDDDSVGWLERARVTTPAGRGSSRLVAALRDTAGLVGAGRAAEALRRLESAPAGGLPELLALVRDELLDWTWTGPEENGRAQPEPWRRGTAVLTDAVVAAWHADSLSGSLADQLAAPYRRVVGPPALTLGPQEPLVARLLAGVAAAGPGERSALADAAERARALGGWGPAMHSATWAVHLAGRERPAAAAQLAAVQALHAGGLDAAAAAAGAWNLGSGAVQAAIVADLVDDAARHRLVDPVSEVLRPLAP